MTKKLSDRELDALVAEKVMGWRRERGMWVGDGPLNFRDDTPPFSTDIAAAWQVVEKMGTDADFKLTGPHGEQNEEWIYEEWIWIASFRYNQFVAGAKTAPRAICLAALRALGVEVAG